VPRDDDELHPHREAPAVHEASSVAVKLVVHARVGRVTAFRRSVGLETPHHADARHLREHQRLVFADRVGEVAERADEEHREAARCGAHERPPNQRAPVEQPARIDLGKRAQLVLVRLRDVRQPRRADADGDLAHAGGVEHAARKLRAQLGLPAAVAHDGRELELPLLVEHGQDKQRLDVVGVRAGVGDDQDSGDAGAHFVDAPAAHTSTG
jgi:hypothetical protein